jgi:hypothetical protein
MVFQNKRHLSGKKLEEVAKKIGLDDEEKNFLSAIYNKEKNKSGEMDLEAESTYQKYRPAFAKEDAKEAERKTVTRSLKYLLVFNAYDFPYYRNNPKQVQKDLNIPEGEFTAIYNELINEGMIKEVDHKVEVLRNNLVVGNDSHEELIQHVIDLKHLSLSLIEKYQKVVDPTCNVSIIYHLMLDEEARLKVVDAIKKLQHEILNISKSCKNPNQYFILPVDFQKIFETPTTTD